VPKDRVTPDTWPAVTYEEHPWQPRGAEDNASQRQRRRHQGPYRSAVPAPIATCAVLVSSGVAADAEEATNQIIRLDALIGGSSSNEFAPLAAVLLRTESTASSQIEQVTAGARALALGELGEPTGRNAELVVRNVRAMQSAVALADEITGQSVLDMHQALLGHHQPEIAGRWRTEQVWIGGSGLGPHHAEFVPPHHTRVPEAMRDLVAFVARDDVPALVQAAIAHAQFETIHPFADGNGRVGRALIHAILRHKGLTRRLTVPISAGLLTDIDGYFDALTRYRQGDLLPLITRVSDAAVEAERNGRWLLDDLAAIRAGWQARLSARRDAAVWRVVDIVLRQPVVDTAFVARELAVSTVAAQNAIDQLVSVDVLVPATSRSRNRIWQAGEVLAALDEFAARAGRRTHET